MRALWFFPLCLAAIALGAPAWAEDPPAAAPAAQDQPPPLPAAQEQPPPLPPPQPAATYYVAVNNQPVGPLTLQQLEQRIRANQLTRADTVWKSGTPNWVRAEELAEVRQLFEAAPPVVPESNAWRDYLVGTWQSSGESAQGYSWEIRTQFNRDGTYSGFQRLAMQGSPAGVIPLAGKWTVRPAGPEGFSLTLNPPGETATTIVLKRIDQNTLLNENDGSQAYRVAN